MSPYHEPYTGPLIRPDFVPSFQSDVLRFIVVESGIESVYHPALIERVQRCGLRITDYIVMVMPPHAVLAIHADGSVASTMGKLNYYVGGAGSRVEWFRPVVATSPERMVNTGAKYLNYREDEVEFLYGTELSGSQHILNGGIPHRAVNGPVPRVCITTVFRRSDGVPVDFDAMLRVLAQPWS